MIWLMLVSFFLLLISWITKKLHQTLGILVLICLLFGIGLGYFHQIPPLKVVRALSEIPLILFLFLDGVRLHFPKIVHFHKEAFKQMTRGFFIQAFLGLLLAHYLLALPWLSSTLLACALSAIDLKATPTPLRDKKIPPRVSQILNLESSATSLFAVTLFMIFHERAILPLVIPAILGVCLGFLVVYLANGALKRHLAQRSFLVSSLFVAPFALFYLCQTYEWNGYIGVIALSLTLGHAGRSLCDGLFDLGRRQGKLLFFLFIITFGCQILGSLAHTLTLMMILYAFLSLFVIRFIGVLVSFSKVQFRLRTAIFCALFGPRALIPAALALLMLPYNFPVYATLYGTVLLSLVVHTLFSFALTQWYGSFDREKGKKEFLPTVLFPD